MNKHTPGPWFVHSVGGNSRLRIGSDTYDIAEMFPAGMLAEAPNARLIAAAPDMLEALQDIAGLSAAYASDAKDIAREAIAQATGGRNAAP